jgi:cell division protein FtsQ
MPRHSPIYTRLHEQDRLTAESSAGEVIGRPIRLLRWFVILALLGLILFGIQNAYSALTDSDLFRLEDISVIGNEMLTSREVVARSGLDIGANLFDTDLQSATSRLTGHPMVRGALLLRQPPGSLVITIDERRPLALLSTPNGLIGLDGEGTLCTLPPVPLDLPIITHIKALTDSNGVQHLGNLVRFLKALDACHFLEDVSEICPIDQSEARVLMVSDGLDVRMRFENAKKQADSLRAFLSHPHGEGMSYVDLRYNNQVVVGKR